MDWYAACLIERRQQAGGLESDLCKPDYLDPVDAQDAHVGAPARAPLLQALLALEAEHVSNHICGREEKLNFGITRCKNAAELLVLVRESSQ